MKAKEAAELASNEQASALERYNKTFDDLVAKLPEDVSEASRDYIRLKAEKLLWQDNAARQRVLQGAFTDVPKYISKASALVTAETKAAATKEHETRSDIEARGSKTIVPAADNVAGAGKEAAPGTDPIWGDINKAEIERAYR